MNDSLPHVADRPKTHAAHTACSECPFRASNVGKKHPEEDWYTTRQWTTGWRGVSQEGDLCACHLTYPMGWKEEWAEQGYQKPVDTGTTRECAGAAALVHRELIAAQAYPSWEAYHDARPTGLSRKAFTIYWARFMGELQPPFRAPEALPEDELIKPEDFVDQDSPEWKYSPASADAIIRAAQAVLPQVRGDDHGYFARHQEAHETAPMVTAEGLDVRVDTALRPLLTTLAGHGIRTLASCHDFHGLMSEHCAHRINVMMHRPMRGTLNYETVLRRREAFIRIRNQNAAEHAFIAAAGALDSVTIEGVSLLTQLVFPLEKADELATLVG